MQRTLNIWAAMSWSIDTAENSRPPESGRRRRRRRRRYRTVFKEKNNMMKKKTSTNEYPTEDVGMVCSPAREQPLDDKRSLFHSSKYTIWYALLKYRKRSCQKSRHPITPHTIHPSYKNNRNLFWETERGAEVRLKDSQRVVADTM